MSSDAATDRWATWLLETRFAGDPALKQVFEEHLFPVRDRVLANAAVKEGDTILDVGAGDGLIAFGALPLVGERGKVIFSDISRPLLEESRKLAGEAGVLDRVEFLLAPADDLSALPDASVDVVTTRSVLIYVERKGEAFREFHRVLRPGGRLSIFEPINRFRYPEPPGWYLGVDMRPIWPIASKVRALYRGLQPLETDPMVDFDERDLLDEAERAGFAAIHLDYQATIEPRAPRRWEHLLHTSGNPNIPTLEVAMAQALTPDEARAFSDYLRPRWEAGEGVQTSAVAYLRARK